VSKPITPKRTKIIGSVQRAIDILNLFDNNKPELGTTDIAKAMNLPKSTVAGLVSTLVTNGYLNQNPENRKYRLGFKLAERAGVLLEQFDLRQIAAPVLERLRDQCNESVNLAIRDDDHVVYIERLHGKNMLAMRSEIGKREWIHSTALGKAILSKLSAEEMHDFINRHELIRVTPQTITDQDAFLDELLRTRERGYAIDDQENELGGRCVAAPIYNLKCDTVAAVSISVPLQRLPDSMIDHLGKKVKSAGKEISRRLGAPIQKEENGDDL
jgi:DNA-binding IclR family transcriptional regulator